MNLFQIIITAVLSTLVVIVFGIVGAWSLWPNTVEASATLAAHSGAWQATAGDRCKRLNTKHLEIGEIVIATALDLDDTQKETLAGVTQVVESWRAQASATCEATDFSDIDSSLLAMQTVLNQTAEAVGELRPVISTLYQSLDEEQRQTLHTHLQSHRNHGRRGFGHRFGH